MNQITIQHVTLNELPESWRAQLPQTFTKHVTVRIEEEIEVQKTTKTAPLSDNPLFGIWQDKAETADVATYVRQLRNPRY